MSFGPADTAHQSIVLLAQLNLVFLREAKLVLQRGNSRDQCLTLVVKGMVRVLVQSCLITCLLEVLKEFYLTREVVDLHLSLLDLKAEFEALLLAVVESLALLLKMLLFLEELVL